jgi:cell division protein FtsQ
MKRTRRNRRKAAKRELPKLPPMPRLSVNWRACFSVAAALGIAALMLALGRDLIDLPIRTIHISGPFQRVTSLEITAAEQSISNQSFLGIDLDEVRQRITDIVWVDHVRLQRVWPDTLNITYSEHRAAARWGATGLLNTRGELFTDDARQEYRELPLLEGPAGSHRRVAARYLQIRDQLAGTSLLLESIRMDPRGAFSIELAGGLTVRIGRDDIDGRIDRFFAVAVPELASDLGRIAYFDMRYPNGFAVGWRETKAASSQLARLNTGG